MKLINPIIGSKDKNILVKKKKGTRIHNSVEATFDYSILCNENPPKKRLWIQIIVKWVEKKLKYSPSRQCVQMPHTIHSCDANRYLDPDPSSYISGTLWPTGGVHTSIGSPGHQLKFIFYRFNWYLLSIKSYREKNEMHPKLDYPYWVGTHCWVIGGALAYVQLFFNTSSTSRVVLILGGTSTTNFIMDGWHFHTPRKSEIAFLKWQFCFNYKECQGWE